MSPLRLPLIQQPSGRLRLLPPPRPLLQLPRLCCPPLLIQIRYASLTTDLPLEPNCCSPVCFLQDTESICHIPLAALTSLWPCSPPLLSPIALAALIATVMNCPQICFPNQPLLYYQPYGPHTTCPPSQPSLYLQPYGPHTACPPLQPSLYLQPYGPHTACPPSQQPLLYHQPYGPHAACPPS